MTKVYNVDLNNVNSNKTVINTKEIVENLLSPLNTLPKNLFNNFKIYFGALSDIKKFNTNYQKFVSVALSQALKPITDEENINDFLLNYEWPLFYQRYMDNTLNRKIEELYFGEGISKDFVDEAICNYFNEDELNNYLIGWKEFLYSTNKNELYDILRNAVHLIQIKEYYGAVALLMCQTDGIFQETEKEIKDNKEHFSDLETSVECIKGIMGDDSYPNKARDKTREKIITQLVIAMEKLAESVSPRYVFACISLIKYLSQATFASKINGTDKDVIRNNANPLRNKICHGVQFNYGTKVHAVKAFLIIDSLLVIQATIFSLIDDNENNKEEAK